MEVKPFGTRDVFRIVVTLIVVILVGVFVASIEPWILNLALFTLAYVLILEVLKYYLGMKQLKKKKFVLPPSF